MEEKKPDIIVWDKDRGYYSKELTYGSNVGAPAIKTEDVIGWRDREVVSVNHQFKTKYEELKSELDKLITEYDWNNLIYRLVDYNFIPIIGETYHLYERDNGSYFMSLIEPEQWNKKHIASFKLDSSNKWIKL